MSSIDQKENPRHVQLLSFVFFTVLLVYLLDEAFFCIISSPLFHDQLWYLYAASRWLAGVPLYSSRLVETNPPLAIWASALPAMLSSHLPLSPMLAERIVIAGAMIGSAIWCARILRAHGVLSHLAHMFLAVAAVLALETTPMSIFGQREHLLVILVLPYLLEGSLFAMRTRRSSLPTSEQIALGIVGGVGICFKPHYVLLLLSFELTLVLSKRSWRSLFRPALVAATSTLLLYVGLIFWGAPIYLRETLPILRDTYWAFGGAPLRRLIVRLSRRYLAYWVVTALAWFLLRRRMRHSLVPLALLVCSLSGELIFLVQRTGWDYHTYPRAHLLYAAMLWIVAEGAASLIWTPDVRDPGLSRKVAFCVCVTAVSLLITGVRALRRPAFDEDFRLPEIFRSAPPGTTVVLLSPTLTGMQTVVSHQLLWGSRYAHLFMLPAIIKNETPSGQTARKKLSPERLQQLTDLQRTTIAEDLRRDHPAIVVVPRCDELGVCQAIDPVHFDLLGWFLESQAFASEWTHYQQVQGNVYYDAFVRR